MAGGRTSVRERIQHMTNDPALLVMADALDDWRDEVTQAVARQGEEMRQALARQNWTIRFVLGVLLANLGLLVTALSR